MPDSLIVLTGAPCSAAALIAGGKFIDAVWVDGSTGLLGGDAVQALMSSAEGTLSAYRFDDERLLAALPWLWRSVRDAKPMRAKRIDANGFIAEARASGRSCALLVASDEPGAALFHDGELVAVYTVSHPRPVTTADALRSLLKTGGARVTVIAPPPSTGAPTQAEAEPLEIADAPAAAESDTTFTSDALVVLEPSVVDAETSSNGVVHPAADELLEVEELHSDQATEAREVREFVPPRLEIDIDGLRAELTAIAVTWLGADDAAAVAAAIDATRPGVDDFVSTIASIGAMEIPNHENAVLRAMAREMHYRATEVLCGV
jgi:hypothetical protein